MQFFQDPKAMVAVLTLENERYEFDFNKIITEDARGVEHRLYQATTFLTRFLMLKKDANKLYYQVKARLTAQYWRTSAEKNFAALGLPEDGKTKPGATHLTSWMQCQDDYNEYKGFRDFVEDSISALTMTYIPRLRDLATKSAVGERETSGTQPPQSNDDPFPSPQAGSAGVR
jgi:hypothetical protein